MMKKHFPHISTFFITLAVVFVVSEFVLPQVIDAASQKAEGGNCPPNTSEVTWFNVNGICYDNKVEADAAVNEGKSGEWFSGSTIGGYVADAVLFVFGWISLLVLQITTWLLGAAGVVLNLVVQETIVDMAENMKKATVINTAWTTIRDIANMGFIFILLYAAIKTILGMGSDTKKLVINIIIIAILINFSLFFTKVVIDASNVIAITFYDAIAPGALDGGVNTGLSDKMMAPLKLGTIWDNPNVGFFEGRKLILIGIFGSAFVLIASFIFFSIAILFVIRFVVLILVLILSPIAFIAFVIPGLSNAGKQWREALLGQAFFAPIYFMLTYIVILIVNSNILGDLSSGGFGTAFVDNETKDIGAGQLSVGPMGIILNFIIVITFLIASLTISKSWANKAGGAVANINKWAGKAAGRASFGLAGFAGRQTVGRVGNLVGESETLKRLARSDSATGRIAGRLGLSAGRKTAGASFDVRGTTMGGSLDAGKAQKGGFTQYIKDKEKKEVEFAASLAPSAKAKVKSEEARRKTETEYKSAVEKYGKDSPEAKKAREKLEKARERFYEIHGNKKEVDDEVTKLEKKREEELRNVDSDNAEKLKEAENSERSAHDTLSRLETEVTAAGVNATNEQKRELEAARDRLREIENNAHSLRYAIKESKNKITNNYKNQIDTLRQVAVIEKGEVTRRLNFADVVQNSMWAEIGGYNYSGSAKIRASVSNKDKIVEAVRALEKEGGAVNFSEGKTDKEEKSDDKNSKKT